MTCLKFYKYSFSFFCLLIGSSALIGADVKGNSSNVFRDEAFVYTLSSFDKVKVSVFGEDELSTEQLVSDGGMISVPLLGQIKIGGKTESEAANLIKQAFVKQEYLRNPVVLVSIEEFAPKVVTVLGEVKHPGSVDIPPGRNGLPIQIVIAGAGGFSGTAKATEVAVNRANPQGQESSKIVVNVDGILKAKAKVKGPTQDFLIYANDVVYVPRRVF